MKVYGFVGPSGTGKSYRAQMVASEKEISFIIDDGLLIKDNQVIAVESVANLDLDLIHSKARKVKKRVGEMLGIKTEETKIISVTNEKDSTGEEISKENNAQQEQTEQNKTLPNENPLFTPNTENPLFSNNISDLKTETVDPEDNIDNTKDDETDNNFWFPSDMPDALNDLPDLEVTTDNFFGNNDMPSLNFPDLKLDFGQSNTEDK